MAQQDHLHSDEQKVPVQIRRKRSFIQHQKKISDTMQLEFIDLFDKDVDEFKKVTAAMLRDNPNLFSMNEIGTIATDGGEISLSAFQSFFEGLLKPDLSEKIFDCIDHLDGKDGIIRLTAITRYLSGRSKVTDRRAKTIIDESWLIDTVKHVDIGQFDEDGNNQIELSEFKHYFAKIGKEVPDDLLEKLFYDIDKKGKGYITTFEYFKWKDGFKNGQVRQLQPANIRKSTTQFHNMKGGTVIPTKKQVRILSIEEHKKDEEIDTLKKEVEKQDDIISNLTEENEKLKNEYESIKTENNNTKNENDDIKKKLNTKEEELKLKNDKLNELENENESIKIEVNDIKKTLNTKEEELKLKDDKLNELENETKNYQQKNAKLNSEMEALKKLLKQTQEEMAKKDDEMNVLSMSKNDNEAIEKLNRVINEKDQIIQEKNERIIKICNENEAERQMIERDKSALMSEINETYEIVNAELASETTKSHKRNSKKIKKIEEPEQLRKQLKKLKSKIDIKEQKLKEKYRQSHDFDNENISINVDDDKQETKDNIPAAIKSLLLFLKDF